MNKKQSGSAHSAVVVILVFLILGLLGFVFWQNFNNTEVKTHNNSQTNKSDDNSSVSDSQKDVNEIYAIYRHRQTGHTVNGDNCDTESILTLFTSDNMATLNNSSCLGTSIKVGVYTIKNTSISIDFRYDIDTNYDRLFNYKSNKEYFRIDKDGVVDSSFYTPNPTFEKIY